MNVPGEHLLNDVGQRVSPVEPDAGAARGRRDAVAGNQGQGGHHHRRRQHRHGRGAYRTPAGRQRTIVYRRTKSETWRVEELHHALEEGIQLKVLRAPCEFVGDDKTHFVTGAKLDIIELGAPDASGRRSPVASGKTEMMETDLAIMALGNTANPIIKDSEPTLKTTKWGTIDVVAKGSQQTSLEGIYTGGDAAAARPRFVRPATAKRRRARSSATSTCPPTKSGAWSTRPAATRTSAQRRRRSWRRSN
jgi:glutamate synthase (NADPH/NADH) small chain